MKEGEDEVDIDDDGGWDSVVVCDVESVWEAL